MTASTPPENTALAVVQSFDLSPRNFEEAWRMAEYLSDSDMVPKDFKGKPANCLVAIQWGGELGLKTMQAIQNIAVINGRPSLWGDVMLAMVRSSPLCEYFIESWEGSGDTLKAIARTKRRGEPVEQIREFSMADAKAAQLLGKDTYKQYGKRMIQMRARGWIIRDVYTDVIKGLHMAEEAMDMPAPEKYMGPADVVGAAPAAATGSTEPSYPQADFDANFAAWSKVIEGGKKTAAQIIAMVNASAKGALTEPQKAKLLSVKSKTADATPKTTGGDAFTAPTYAEVAGKLTAAKTQDELNLAGDLIKSVLDDAHRAELQVLFDKREAEITPKE